MYTEVISKLLKNHQRHNLRPAQGVFPAVTFPPSHKAVADKSGSHLKLPYPVLWFCSLLLF